MKHRINVLFAVAAVALVAAAVYGGRVFFAPTEPKVDFAGIYLPVIMWGDPGASERVTFLWGSRQASADAFSRYVVPLIAKARRTKTFSVAMIQEFGNEQPGRLPDGSEYSTDVRGPGALLFCAPTRDDYVRIAFAYLTSSAERAPLQPLRGGPKGLFYTNGALLDAFKQTGIDLGSCTRTDLFYNRLASVVGFSTPDRDTRGIKDLPAFIVKGKTITMRDRDGLRQIEKLSALP